MNEQVQAEVAAIRQSLTEDVASIAQAKAQYAAQLAAMGLKIKELEAEVKALKEPKEA